MKTTPLNCAIQAVAACALLGFGSAGWAASTWTTTGCTTAGTNVASVTELNAKDGFNVGTPTNANRVTAALGNSYNCASTGDSVGTMAKATAFSNTATGAKFATAYLAPNGSSGFGVKNAIEGFSVTQPDHAMDNATQTDLISLKFTDASVALNSISSGWWSGDADLSVLAYTGSDSNYSLMGKTIADLKAAGSGWTLVSHISNLGTGTTTGATKTFNNSTTVANISSSWWLVSAYNVGYGSLAALTGSSDYVKLLAVAGKVTPRSDVPEPGSLALVGAGLLGFLATRRKAKGKSLGLAA